MLFLLQFFCRPFCLFFSFSFVFLFVGGTRSTELRPELYLLASACHYPPLLFLVAPLTSGPLFCLFLTVVVVGVVRESRMRVAREINGSISVARSGAGTHTHDDKMRPDQLAPALRSGPLCFSCARLPFALCRSFLFRCVVLCVLVWAV